MFTVVSIVLLLHLAIKSPFHNPQHDAVVQIADRTDGMSFNHNASFAVLLFGAISPFCLDHQRQLWVSELNADIFVHRWVGTSFKGVTRGSTADTYETYASLKRAYGASLRGLKGERFDNTVEQQLENEHAGFPYPKHLPHVNDAGIHSLLGKFYSIKAVNAMKMAAEKNAGMEYDAVLLVRRDWCPFPGAAASEKLKEFATLANPGAIYTNMCLTVGDQLANYPHLFILHQISHGTTGNDNLAYVLIFLSLQIFLLFRCQIACPLHAMCLLLKLDLFFCFLRIGTRERVNSAI